MTTYHIETVSYGGTFQFICNANNIKNLRKKVYDLISYNAPYAKVFIYEPSSKVRGMTSYDLVAVVKNTPERFKWYPADKKSSPMYLTSTGDLVKTMGRL